jgi:hypothetical protein
VAFCRRVPTPLQCSHAVANQGDPVEVPKQFGARGVNGTLVVMPDRIIIRRKRALLPWLGQGIKGSKEIAIDQVSGTQLKRATAFINGYIGFSLVGGAETRLSGFAAAQDDDSIMFTNKQQPGFEKAKELVDLYREAARKAAAE